MQNRMKISKLEKCFQPHSLILATPDNNYTILSLHIQTLLTGYVGLILHSTTMAATSHSTIESTMRGQYSDATVCRVALQPSVKVASAYPHSTLNSTATCSSLSGIG